MVIDSFFGIRRSIAHAAVLDASPFTGEPGCVHGQGWIKHLKRVLSAGRVAASRFCPPCTGTSLRSSEAKQVAEMATEVRTQFRRMLMLDRTRQSTSDYKPWLVCS